MYPRSCLSLQSILVGGGVVHSDYRGSVRVIMTNLSNKRVEFETGDRITQVLFIKKEEAEFEEVSSFDDFVTSSGNKGFGSTKK